MFRQGFSCPALLVSSLVPPIDFHIRGYHPLWPTFPCRFVNLLTITRRLFPFRSPLLWESRLMSFPQGTEMVQFPWFASCILCIQMPIPFSGGFPHSETSGSMLVCQLPEVFRRLPRLSSPIIAKASTTCSCSLDPITLKPKSYLQTSRSLFQVHLRGLAPRAFSCRNANFFLGSAFYSSALRTIRHYLN